MDAGVLLPANWVRSGAGELAAISAAGDRVTLAWTQGPAGSLERIDLAGGLVWSRAITTGGTQAPSLGVFDSAATQVTMYSASAVEFASSGAPTTMDGSLTQVFGLASYDQEGAVRWARTVASTSAVTAFVPPTVIDGSGVHAWSAWLNADSLHVESDGDRAWGAKSLIAVINDEGTVTSTFVRDAGRAVRVLEDGTLLVVTDRAVEHDAGDGVVVWSHPLDSAHTVDVTVALPSTGGDWIASGRFSGVTTFAPGEANATELVSSGTEPSDGLCGGFGPQCAPLRYPFVARYTEDGAMQWVRRPFGADSEAVTVATVIAEDDGSVSVLGSYFGDATFDAGLDTERTLHSPAEGALFLATLGVGGALTDLHTIGTIGCLDLAAAARTDAGWVIAAVRRHTLAAECGQDLAIRDGVLATELATATSPRWFVAQVLPP